VNDGVAGFANCPNILGVIGPAFGYFDDVMTDQIHSDLAAALTSRAIR
jgi:hypothetical protein